MNYWYVLNFVINLKFLGYFNKEIKIYVVADTKAEAKSKAEESLKRGGYEIIKFIAITKLSKKN